MTSRPKLAVPSVAIGGIKTVNRWGFSFSRRVHGQYLAVRYSFAAACRVGVGFETPGTAEGSGIVVGCVNDGAVTLQDHFGTGQSGHQSRQSLSRASFLFNILGQPINGATTLALTRPLQAGGPYDLSLSLCQTVLAIMVNAAADTTDLAAYRRPEAQTAFTVQL